MVEIKPLIHSPFTPLEVADFYLEVQEWVEATGQNSFGDSIWDAWNELQQVEAHYAMPGNFWVAQDNTDRLVGCVGLRNQGDQHG